MGLFGGSKTYVSSVVYNMAGDEADRPNYLKTTVMTNVITNSKSDMADAIQNGYIRGPGIKLRSFGRWSQGEYSAVMGTVTSRLFGGSDIDVEVLAEQIPHEQDHLVWVQRVGSGRADPDWWADQYMLKEHSDLFESDWSSDIDENTGELVILLEDGVTFYRIQIPDYDPSPSVEYVYAAYSTSVEAIVEPEEPEEPVDPPEEGEDPVEPPPPETEIVYSELKVFIYKAGTGKPLLDAMLAGDGEDDGFYFPPIPIRLNNKFIGPDKDQWTIADLPEESSEETIDAAFKARQDAKPEKTLPINFPSIYPMAEKGMKKAINGKFDKVATNIAKNINLADIDYAYAVFGATLNTKEKSAQRYLWLFFNKLLESQSGTSSQIADWQAKLAVWNEQVIAWAAWHDGGEVGPEPIRTAIPTISASNIKIASSGNPLINYDIQIDWAAMALTRGNGLGRPGAKKGDVWWVARPSLQYEEVLFNKDGVYGQGNLKKLEVVAIYKQVSANRWEAISIWGLVHKNWIYKDKFEETTGREAIEFTDGDSPFIVPLHYETFKEMSLVDATQMGTACCYLQLNCYKVVKKKWYQTLAFKIFLVIAIVAITYFTGGFGASSVGLLGTNAAVGAAIGATGTLAVIIGAVANAIAAMLILKAISALSVVAFGDKVGAIIGAIAGMVAMAVGVGLMNGGNMSSIMAQMGKADSIIRMTSAVGSGIQGYVAAATQEISGKIEDLQKQTEAKSDEIADLYAANIGSDRASFDPMALIMYESQDVFLSRTLMTGSDVVDFSLNLITNFAELTTSTDLP